MTFRDLSRGAGALGLAFVLSGCVLSVEPVVPESAATFDTRLLGTWEEASGSDRAVISRASESTYAIEYTTDGKVTRFEARLGRLGDRVVLDVWAAPGDGEVPEPYAGVLIAGHLPLLLDVAADEVQVTALEEDVLLEALRAGSVDLAFRDAKEQVVLLGTTDEMHEALAPYLARPGALSEPNTWRRVPPARAAAAPEPVEVPCFEAAAWPEGDRLFHRDPHWVGADGASSVDLGGGRILWLFGDTWIDPSGRGTRHGARMVSNSVGIQEGSDPSTSSIAFAWGRAPDGAPDAFFPDRRGESLWLGNGVRVADRLVLFFSRTLRGTGTGLGFESVGWTAVMVENPDDAPSAWRVRELDTPANPLGVLVGYAAAFRLGDTVIALGSLDPVKSHPIYAVRWPAEQVRRGDLSRPEWWAGNRLGWVPDADPAPRRPIFENGQADLTIHLDPVTERFLEVQTQGFGPADVAMRAAPALTGPWSRPRMLYRPPEYYRPHVMIYSAKAHPHLAGADLVLTYATNTFQGGDLVSDSRLYYPRFVRLTRCP